MIDLEGVVPAPPAVTYPDMVMLADPEGQILLGSVDAALPAATGDDSVLLDAGGGAGDEWIGQMLSSTSTDALAAGFLLASGDVLLDPRSNEEASETIVITAKRPPKPGSEWDGEGGGTGGETGGYTAGGGGGGPTGPTATPAEQHSQDCGTEDGAAVQVAKHVIGALPAGVSGPPDPVTTSAGTDWTAVEFGAVIVRNADGSFGALNNMIYSSNQPNYVALPSGIGQPVQGLWHSHPTRDGPNQWAIDRYPSSGDWSGLARVAGQAGAAADPSLWITGPDGVTREFSLSERSYFESLATDSTKMVNGDGLAGKERAQSCG